jgi:hypothetical protein
MSNINFKSLRRTLCTPVSGCCQCGELMVMSSCLCKNLEGAGFPFQVKAMEDGIDNSVNAIHVHKADHRSRPSPHFHKATLDNIGGEQLLPEMIGKVKERQQLRQIFL